MSTLKDEDLKLLSDLCRIDLEDHERSQMLVALKSVLDYAEQLSEVDITDLVPYSHIEEQGIAALREDIVGDLLPREVFLDNSPDQVGGMIRVPPVMKSDV